MGLIESAGKKPQLLKRYDCDIPGFFESAKRFGQKLEHNVASPAEVFVKRLLERRSGENGFRSDFEDWDPSFFRNILDSTIETAYHSLTQDEKAAVSDFSAGEVEKTIEVLMGNREARAEFERIFLKVGKRVTRSERLADLDGIILGDFRGLEFEMLDVGACPEYHGAPTSEDTASQIPSARVVSIDIFYPTFFFPPKESRVDYWVYDAVKDGLDAARFIVVRAANFLYQFMPEIAADLRLKLGAAVAPEGLLITGNDSSFLVEKKLTDGTFRIHEKSPSKDPNSFWWISYEQKAKKTQTP